MCALEQGIRTSHTFSFEPGDTLLLFTDGLVEARDASGAFYPLEGRLAQWAKCSPEALIEWLQRDLLTYTGGALRDDAAVLVIRRAGLVHDGRRYGELVGSDGRQVADHDHR